MPRRDIIAVGASAGGVEALSALVAGLPADLPAAVFVVLHVPSTATSMLPAILSRAGPLPARHPEDGERFRPGQVYVAPPNCHLLLRNGHVHLSHGPKENGHRPAIDPLFRSAAREHGSRVIGIVLSGALDDGTQGLMLIKQSGGSAIVQSPDEALFSSMPMSASKNVEVDAVLPVREIPEMLTRLAGTEATVTGVEGMDGDERLEAEIGTPPTTTVKEEDQPGKPSVFTCPECHGTLWELSEDELLHFRCRIGHAYSIESLTSGQNEALEAALWTALRSLEEREAMARRMERRARDFGHDLAAGRFAAQAGHLAHYSDDIRRALDRSITVLAQPVAE